MVEAKGAVAVEGDGVCDVVGRVVATASESLFFQIGGSKDVVGHVATTVAVAGDPAEYPIPAKWNSERKTTCGFSMEMKSTQMAQTRF